MTKAVATETLNIPSWIWKQNVKLNRHAKLFGILASPQLFGGEQSSTQSAGDISISLSPISRPTTMEHEVAMIPTTRANA